MMGVLPLGCIVRKAGQHSGVFQNKNKQPGHFKTSTRQAGVEGCAGGAGWRHRVGRVGKVLRKLGGDGDATSQHRAGSPEREGSGERVIAVDHRVDTVEHLIYAANLGNMPAIAAVWWTKEGQGDRRTGGCV